MVMGGPGTLANRTIDALETKVRQSGKSCPNLKAEVFFMANKAPMASQKASQLTPSPKAPPRLVSDQMVNIFFQEWAPLFPVLQRPTFLKLYAEYVACPEGVENQQSIAQLHLVFAIGAVSAEVRLFGASARDSLTDPEVSTTLSDGIGEAVADGLGVHPRGKYSGHTTMFGAGTDLLHRKRRLSSVTALQGHRDQLVPSDWAAPKPQAVPVGNFDPRNEEEGLLDTIYIGLVCFSRLINRCQILKS
jgi:hypothetical protein